MLLLILILCLDLKMLFLLSLFLWVALYEFARVAITKYHRLGHWNNRNIWSHRSRGQNSNNKVLISLVSSETTLLSLQMADFSPCLHLIFLLCVHIPRLYVFNFLFLIRTLVRLDEGSIWGPYVNLMTSLNALYLNIIISWDIEG